VFGRAAGAAAAAKRSKPNAQRSRHCRRTPATIALAAPRPLPQRQGQGTTTAKLRATHAEGHAGTAAVFRTGETLQAGAEPASHEVHRRHRRHRDLRTVRMVWNTDLIETLEFDNLIVAGRGDR